MLASLRARKYSAKGFSEVFPDTGRFRPPMTTPAALPRGFVIWGGFEGAHASGPTSGGRSHKHNPCSQKHQRHTRCRPINEGPPGGRSGLAHARRLRAAGQRCAKVPTPQGMSSASFNRWILPEGPFGSSSRKCTLSGVLKAPRRSSQKRCKSSDRMATPALTATAASTRSP